jgi:ribosomal protein S18 acetylase RimI-like enzyme
MPQSTLANWLARKQSPIAPSPGPKALPQSQDEQPKSAGLSEHEEASESSRSSSAHPKPINLPVRSQLPANVTIEPCQEKYLPGYRKMNALLLQIPYREDFYKETMEDEVIASVTRLALWHERSSTAASPTATEAKLVAAIRCRVLASPPENPYEKVPVLYISTLTTLGPFREHAIASHLLAEVTRVAIELYNVKAVSGHVWEANADGLDWYKKRGFRVVAHEPEYYRRLAPKTAALVIRRDIGPTDLLTV